MEPSLDEDRGRSLIPIVLEAESIYLLLYGIFPILLVSAYWRMWRRYDALLPNDHRIANDHKIALKEAAQALADRLSSTSGSEANMLRGLAVQLVELADASGSVTTGARKLVTVAGEVRRSASTEAARTLAAETEKLAIQFEARLEAAKRDSLEQTIQLHRPLRTSPSSTILPMTVFAVLIALATDYLLAPAGIRLLWFSDYVSAYGPPQLSTTSASFRIGSLASPVVGGLAGYYLYCVLALAQRLRPWNLSGDLFSSLVVRGVVVVVLGFGLQTLGAHESLSAGGLAFLIGVFPSQGLLFLTSALTKSGATDELPPEARETTGGRLTELPGMNAWREAALQEVGIQSVHDLANCHLEELLFEVSFSPTLLVAAVDTAVLLSALGSERHQKVVALLASGRATRFLGGDERKLSSLLTGLDLHSVKGALALDSRVKLINTLETSYE